jgi:hypothetical protein
MTAERKLLLPLVTRETCQATAASQVQPQMIVMR